VQFIASQFSKIIVFAGNINPVVDPSIVQLTNEPTLLFLNEKPFAA
jgi:hypothetical protein